MEKRRLGRTGLMVSPLGYGGIKLGYMDQDTADEALNRCLDLGINLVDTARGYGDSEKKIARAIGHRRDEFYISSKAHDFTRDDMRRALETSLKELGVDKIDIYKCHNLKQMEGYETFCGPGGGLEALQEAKEEGLIDFIGLSSHRFLETMKRAINSGAFDVIMLVYNILNEELTDEEVIPLAKEKDVGVMVMKPLGGGFLAAPPPEMMLELGKQKKLYVTATEALQFILANDNVSIAVTGMERAEEVEENVRAAETFVGMSDEERKRLIEAAEALGKGFCRNCSYCQPCPQGIKIPVILREYGYYERYGLKEWAKARYSMVEVTAEDCTECGECEEKCPYHIPIMERIREAHKVLSSSG